MANIASLLKVEIARLSKKVAKEQTGPLQTAFSAQRKQISALNRRVAELEKTINRLDKMVSSGDGPATKAGASKSAASGNRFQAKGLRSLRSRLGISAHEFAKLAGVSAQSIYNWETGKSIPRATQVAAIANLRGIGKREALARLNAADQ